MENFIYFQTFRRFMPPLLILISVHFTYGFIETRRFDAKPTARAKYLVNNRPAILRYSDPVINADRRMLLSLTISPPASTQVAEQNSTFPPDIPLIAYGQDESTISKQSPDIPDIPSRKPVKDTSILPSADPFNSDGSSSNIDSTDDLLDLFEQSSNTQKVTPGYHVIPFIPPFTSAPDNLRVESRASYKKVRK